MPSRPRRASPALWAAATSRCRCTADEVNSVLYRQATSAERPRPKLSFEKNENVRIIEGPFANFSGKVDEVNPERNTLRVMVTIFGRGRRRSNWISCR